MLELCVAVFNPEMSLNSDNCGTAGGGEGRASFPVNAGTVIG